MPRLLYILFAFTFLAYLFTLAPTFTARHWGIDTPEMALAAYRFTVPHPSGYPVYLLLGHVFTYLPFGSIAYRLNLMSAVFAALTVFVVAWTVYTGVARTGSGHKARLVGALSAGGLLAFSPTFWSQAVLAEVYTLHTFFVAVIVRVLTSWGPLQLHPAAPADGKRVATVPSRAPGDASRHWLIIVLALAFGLGMGNHTTIALLLPAVLLFLLFTSVHHFELHGTAAPTAAGLAPGSGTENRARSHAGWGAVLRRFSSDAALALPVVLASLIPYALVLVRAHQGAYPSLWDPGTLAALFDHIAGGAFRGTLFSWPDVVASRLLAVPRLLFLQFMPLGVAAAMAGIWVLARYHARFLFFVLTAALSVVLFAVNYPVFDSQVYLLPFYVLVAVMAGWGVAAAVHVAGSVRANPPARPRELLVAAVVVLPLAVPALQFALYRDWVDLSGEDGTHRYFSEVLRLTPENAVLVSGSPDEVLAFWYLQYAEDYRRDVLVVDAFWVPKLESYRRNLSRQFPESIPRGNPPDYFRALAERNSGLRPVLGTAHARDYLEHLPFTERPDGLIEVRTEQLQGLAPMRSAP